MSHYREAERLTSKYKRGLETELRFLRLFAANKEAYQYTLPKKLGVSYRTVLRILHDLEKRGLLQIIRTEESSKQGKKRNVWAITFGGLINLFLMDQKILTQLNLVAKAHTDKLLLFKKWSLFKKHNLGNAISARIKEAVTHHIASTKFSLIISEGKRVPIVEEGLRIAFVADVLGLMIMDEPLKEIKDGMQDQWDTLNKIWKLVNEDHELKQFKDGYLLGSLEEHESKLKNIVEWKNYLKNLS